MGKCISKQPSSVNLTESDFATKGIKRKFSEISDCAPIHEEEEEECYTNNSKNGHRKNEGQSESKKDSKRAAGLETKGTAMSFGFRKKIHASNKKNSNVLKEKGKEKEKDKELIKHQEKLNDMNQTSNTVISHHEANDTTTDGSTNDSNGNKGTEPISDKQDAKHITLPSAKRDTGNAMPSYKGSRFGFKTSNIVRPASVGLTPKITDFEENIENNNVTEKRRSKSATGTQRLQVASTITRNQVAEQQQHASDAMTKISNPKIGFATTTSSTTLNNRSQWFLQQERRNNAPETQQSGFGNLPTSGQYAVINSGMHTNVIVKPTPQSAVSSVSRFTLHTTSLPKPQYPVPISLPSSRNTMDSKNAKQVANSSRKGFTGPREISTDSGIASLDTTLDYSGAGGGGNSPSHHSRGRSRPRNLEMVFNSRHKFDVRDLDDSLSCESVEPLALPKLPSVFSSNNQTVPLNGLVRANINASQEDFQDVMDFRKISRAQSDAESIDEEKLYRDRSTSEKTAKHASIKDYNVSSKNSSPVSSRSSWCNAGESLAPKDCSSFSLSSSDESKDNQNEKTTSKIFEDDISSLALSEKPSVLSSLTIDCPDSTKNQTNSTKPERPNTLSNIVETKFAEMAAAVSDILLDDETSPTDSLVSSTESDEMMLKKEKNRKRQNDDTQEKDIDEISPEIDLLSSPKSPGTPTHASNSLSLSDGGRDFLIDDEIADQPALLFSDKADLIDSNQMRHSLTDTPTLMESNSIKSSAQISKPKLPSIAALEISLRTPKMKRRSTLMSRAESLDTLSPCESIASDDLMMDFETSSLDSIDRLSQSIRSQSGSALNGADDLQIFAELDAKSGDLIREWNNILRVHRNSKDSISSQLPARATRLLNRSRLQQSQLSNAGSDSPISTDSLPHRQSRLFLSGRNATISSDDLLFTDKSFRNSMIQDVQYFKKQLIRLRRVLQDTETLNPFEQSNGKIFPSCELDGSQSTADEKDLSSLASSIADDPRQELADLRRQVVYLQGQLDDRDRTIRIQKNLIDRLESERSTASVATSISEKECINTATQTDRVRPLSIGQEGLARSKPEFASYTTHFPMIDNATTSDAAGRRHTVISTTLTNLNHIASACPTRRASLSLEKLTYKPVKTTMIGDPVSPNTQKSPNDKSNELSPDKILTNGINGITLNGLKKHNGCTIQQQPLTNGAQHSMKTCHKAKEIRFDELKSEHRTQTITIV